MGREFHLKGLTLFGRPGRSPALEVVILRGNTTHHTGLQEQRPHNSTLVRGGIKKKKGCFGCLKVASRRVFIGCRRSRQETPGSRESCRFGCRAGVGGVTIKVSEDPMWETQHHVGDTVMLMLFSSRNQEDFKVYQKRFSTR